MEMYNPKEIETKWQERWEALGVHGTDLSQTQRKLYCLVMFCYPSSDRIHLGHWYNYAPTDAWARFKRMQGYNVFEPVGFDAFGLPAENYAIKTGVHPADSTWQNIRGIRTQLRSVGAMYDWNREVVTCEPRFYRWNQWLFLQLYHNNLAYRKKAPVNWCPQCQTVLANEQVRPGGLCERCDSEVVHRDLTQWFLRITAYADSLLDGLDELDWPEQTKAMQRNWIGRSNGVEIAFHIPEAYLDGEGEGGGDELNVFTTRPDTLFGATYLVLAPEHPLVEVIIQEEEKDAVRGYQAQAARKSNRERAAQERAKTGVFTGAYAVNPINEEVVPIWIADYVVMGYGTGAIMAVPAHDQRDFEFAKRHHLKIREVVLAEGRDPSSRLEEAFTGHGTLVNSGEFSELPSEEGGERMADLLEGLGLAKRKIQYRIRDWLISRQRYWGTPIPIVYCPSCGEVPVPEMDLPVELPYEVDFRLKGEGRSPLATSEGFVRTACPTCGVEARREVDTMDTFVDSSWYFFRYLDPDCQDGPFRPDLVEAWCPVDMYVGGSEHATLHLLYARFVAHVLNDLGHLPFREPFRSLRHQGQITSGGGRMSKSRGNVINPEAYLGRFGSDALRSYLMFGFSYADGGDWDESGIHGVGRYLNRVWRLIEEHRELWAELEPVGEPEARDKVGVELNRTRHRSIRHASEDLDRFQFNTALSRLMELTNGLYQYVQAGLPDPAFFMGVAEDLIKLLGPFAPHLAEELWEQTGHEGSLFQSAWPTADPAWLAEEDVSVVIQINGKKREQMMVPRGLPEEELRERALGHGRIPALLDGQEIRRVVVVPDRLINIVA